MSLSNAKTKAGSISSLLSRANLARLASDFPSLIRPVAIILAVSLVSALSANLFRSEPLAWDWKPGAISSESPFLFFDDFKELERLLEDPAVIVIDARDERLYNIAHIPGAISLPAAAASERAAPFLASIPKESPLLIYCSDPLCSLAERLAEAFADLGRSGISIFRPGFESYSESGRQVAP